jgi:hypothetical protein
MLVEMQLQPKKAHPSERFAAWPQEDPAVPPLHQGHLNGIKLEADMNNEAGTQPVNGHASTAAATVGEEVVDSEATVSISHSAQQPDDQPAVDQKPAAAAAPWHPSAVSPTTSAVGGMSATPNLLYPEGSATHENGGGPQVGAGL